MRRSSAFWLAFSCAVLLATGTAAAAPFGVLDLRTDFDARFYGEGSSVGSGTAVAAAGDVNGDGREDVIFRGGRSRVFVLFGRDNWESMRLDAFGPSDGFIIHGTMGSCFSFELCSSSRSVASAGDVNGDGLDDLVVGSPAAISPSPDPPGSAYVVFGKASGGAVDVRSLGAGGFRIRGESAEAQTGHAVDGAGDVNGDGLADVVVGAPGARSAYIVFGRQSSEDVALASLGSEGFRMRDERVSFGGGTGGAVAGLGDTNGDGLADVIIGGHGVGQGGRAYVVFGKRDAADVDLTALGPRGYSVTGPTTATGNFTAQAGWSVSKAGDMNGDELADMVVGAPGADNAVGGSGSAYVLFGKGTTETVDLNSPSSGFRIDGAGVLHGAGSSVAGGNDVNGDGVPDVVVGEPFAAFDGRFKSGAGYVAFGKASRDPVRLGGLNPEQVQIGGANADDYAGTAVGLADFDRDARADVVIDAPFANIDAVDSGAVYLVLTRLLPRDITVAPVESTNPVGDEHCVTAHVTDAGAGPAAGFMVRFGVTGTNMTSGMALTGSAGDAKFCYTGRLMTGSDQIVAHADGNGNGIQDPGEPSAMAAKEWVAPQSGPDCEVSFHGQITTQAGGKATLSGRAETTGGEAAGRHSYLDRGAALRIKTRDVDALACAEDGSRASLFGEARSRGSRVVYRIDLQAGNRNRGSYRIRLDTGYDSGQRTLRGSLRIVS